MIEKDTELVDGSGNVFRDFGDPEADLKQAKAVLAARIIAVLDDRGLAVRKAASLTGLAAADFSRVRNADLGRFTLDRLMMMLAALDANARVTVKVDLSRPARRRLQRRPGLPAFRDAAQDLLAVPQLLHRLPRGEIAGALNPARIQPVGSKRLSSPLAGRLC